MNRRVCRIADWSNLGIVSMEEFIHTVLGSVDHVRALLLIHSSPETQWNAGEVASKLYVLPEVAEAVLRKLATGGLVVPGSEPGRHRYQPRTPELADLVEQLVTLDRTRPVSLIKMIYARPSDVQAFADAFKLRKEKED